MDIVKFHPFLHLIVLALAQVEMPANVTLHCRNWRNMVQWSYGEVSPGLRFKLEIKQYSGAPETLWVDPPALQADVSNFSDSSNAYSITVTAVVGNHSSSLAAPPNGLKYTYFKDGDADFQICSVDLPTVNVTAEVDNHILFRFTHPWLWHNRTVAARPNQKRKKSYDAHHDRRLPAFEYSARIVDERSPHVFRCVKEVCEQRLAVDPKQKRHCLSITGEVEKTAVNPTQLYCAEPFQEASNKSAYFVIGAVVTCLVVLIIIMLLRKQIMPSTDMPSATNFTGKMKHVMALDKDQIHSVSHVGPRSPTPLLSSPEPDELLTVVPSGESDVRMRIGVSTKKEDENDNTESENPNDEGYIKGGNLEDDESEAPSGYERRPVLVKLGPGEITEGYRG